MLELSTPSINAVELLTAPAYQDIPNNVEFPQDNFSTAFYSRDGLMLTAKEPTMLELMDAITKRPNWHLAALDQ
ncbi:hypothetical protein BDV11DRAFT_195657 [Aspergillus similis]